jgi:uncharacterized phage infection (PIP) family protein YhgE
MDDNGDITIIAKRKKNKYHQVKTQLNLMFNSNFKGYPVKLVFLAIALIITIILIILNVLSLKEKRMLLKEYEAIKNSNIAKIQEKDKVNEELIKYQNENEVLNSQIKTASHNSEQIINDINKLQEKNVNLKTELDENKRKGEELEEELSKLLKENNLLTKQIKQLRDEISSLNLNKN